MIDYIRREIHETDQRDILESDQIRTKSRETLQTLIMEAFNNNLI